MVLTYIKRTIVLGFLIIIAPLITITYSIDRMGDGKSQALNTWLREFIFTVIIQPFHCIIYLVFYASMVSTLETETWDAIAPIELGKTVFIAASAFFMLKAESIIKKIFGIQPSGIGDAIGTGAMALSMGTSLFKGKGGKKVNDEKGKQPKMDKKNEKKGGTPPVGDQPGGDSPGGDSPGGDSLGGNSPGGDHQEEIHQEETHQEGIHQEGIHQEETNQEEIHQESQKGKKAKRAIKNFVPTVARHIERSIERNGGTGAYIGRMASRGAAVAGLIAGATVGDAKTAISVSTAAKGAVESGADSIRYRRAEKQLAKNQEEFAGAYEDFARAYKAEHGEDISDKEISQRAKEIFDHYESGDIPADFDNEYSRDFYDVMSQLSDSAEYIGYKNGYDYVKDSMRMVQGGAVTPKSNYVPKDYSRNSQNDNN